MRLDGDTHIVWRGNLSLSQSDVIFFFKWGGGSKSFPLPMLHVINRVQCFEFSCFFFILNLQVYSIKVTVNDCSWSVQHRYSEFVELHEALLGINKENKSLKLPPKRVFGNSSKSFIQKRQKDLEVYLQTALEKNPTLPKPLLHFLEFDIYVSVVFLFELFGIIVQDRPRKFLR